MGLNSPGHITHPKRAAEREAQFYHPATTEEAVIMGLTETALLISPLMGKTGGRAGAAESAQVTRTFELEATHGLTMSRRQFADLKADIATNGIKEPIKFVEHRGTKYVVDGHHRLRAAQELKLSTVPTQRVNLPYGGYKTETDLINTDR
jgi:hypothetical protein